VVSGATININWSRWLTLRSQSEDRITRWTQMDFNVIACCESSAVYGTMFHFPPSSSNVLTPGSDRTE
jgi:hypothetical protein